MPRKSHRRPRGPRRKVSEEVISSRNIFATVAAGKNVACNASEVHFPLDRPCRVTRITGTATVLKGQCGLMELVMYNQGQTQVASTGVLSVSMAGKNFSVRSPTEVDMWIDPGRTQPATLSIFHVDFPCVSSMMKDNVLLFNIKVHYVAGKEQITDTCPTYCILGPEPPPDDSMVVFTR